MAGTFDTLRIGETITVDAESLDQIERPGFLANTSWAIDNGPTTPGDPTTPHAIATSSVANPTTITTTTAHGLVTGDRVQITSHLGSTPAIPDDYYTVTVTGPTTFTIPINVTVGGTGGTVQRANAAIVEVLDGPPPTKYTAELTGFASGSAKIFLNYADAFLVPGVATKNVTVLNASTFAFGGGNIVDGILILDFQDGAGPGPFDVTATPIDSRGLTEKVEYVCTNFQWTDAAGHLALLSATSQTVNVEGESQGDGTLHVTAVNSAGVTISGDLPYRVLSTVSVTLVQSAA